MSDPGDLDLGWESIKSLSANLVQAAIGFVGTVLFARVLGPVSFGGYYFLFSIVLLVNRPIWGFGHAARKRFSEHDSPRGELVSSIAVINLALLAVTAAVLFGTDVLAGRTNVPSANLVFVAILGTIIFFFPFQLLVGASGRPGRATWIDTLRSVFTLPLQIGFVLLEFGAAGLGYGLAAATLLTIPITYYSIGVRPAVPTRETFRSLWEFARYSIPGTFVGKAYDRFDVILLGVIVGTGIAGQYEVAHKLTLPAMFLTGAITSGLVPKVSNLDSREQDPTEDVTNALSYASILAIPIFFGGLALARRLVVTAYGPEYAVAAPYLVGLAFYKVVASQTSIHRSTLSGLDRPDLNLKFSTVALAVNVVLGVALVLAIGGIGVVVATIVAEILRYAASALAVRSELPGVEILPRPLAEQVVAGVAMYGGVVALAEWLVLDSPVVVAAVVTSGAVIYGAVLLVTSSHLRVTIRAVIQDAVFG